MKHIKLFENNIANQLKTTINEYNRFGDLIRDYLAFNEPELDIKDVYYYYFEKDINDVGDEGIIVSYTNSDRSEDTEGRIIFDKQLPELYKFIEDPELYKETKKYNI